MAASFRFIHAADLHLDSPFRGLSGAPSAVRQTLAESTFAAVRRLTDVAIEKDVDFIVIAGDLFDEADRSLRAQLTLVKEWQRLERHGIAVYAIHGNHDHLGGTRASLELPSNVHIFGAESAAHKAAYCKSGELAAYIYGQSYGERAVARNMAEGYRIAPEAPYHIALLHANVGGDSEHDPYSPCSLEELAASGFQYWALGHIHKRQILHEYPHIVYSGNTQGRHPREPGERGCYIVEVDGSRRTSLAFEPLDSVRWLDAEVPIAGVGTEQELLELLERAAVDAAEASGERAVMLRLRLTGRGPMHSRLSTDGMMTKLLLSQLQEALDEPHGDSWLYIYELVDDSASELDFDALAEEDSFTGELLRISGSLRQDAEAWRSFAGAALQPIIGHVKLGRLQRDKWNELPERWLDEAMELAALLIADSSRKR